MAKDTPFTVEATDKGYYGNLRRNPGDRFEIANEAAFSDAWMRRLEAPAPARKSKAKSDDGADVIAMAKELTGRDDITSVDEAEAIVKATDPNEI